MKSTFLSINDILVGINHRFSFVGDNAEAYSKDIKNYDHTTVTELLESFHVRISAGKNVLISALIVESIKGQKNKYLVKDGHTRFLTIQENYDGLLQAYKELHPDANHLPIWCNVYEPGELQATDLHGLNNIRSKESYLTECYTMYNEHESGKEISAIAKAFKKKGDYVKTNVLIYKEFLRIRSKSAWIYTDVFERKHAEYVVAYKNEALADMLYSVLNPSAKTEVLIQFFEQYISNSCSVVPTELLTHFGARLTNSSRCFMRFNQYYLVPDNRNESPRDYWYKLRGQELANEAGVPYFDEIPKEYYTCEAYDAGAIACIIGHYASVIYISKNKADLVRKNIFNLFKDYSWLKYEVEYFTPNQEDLEALALRSVIHNDIINDGSIIKQLCEDAITAVEAAGLPSELYFMLGASNNLWNDYKVYESHYRPIYKRLVFNHPRFEPLKVRVEEYIAERNKHSDELIEKTKSLFCDSAKSIMEILNVCSQLYCVCEGTDSIGILYAVLTKTSEEIGNKVGVVPVCLYDFENKEYRPLEPDQEEMEVKYSIELKKKLNKDFHYLAVIRESFSFEDWAENVSGLSLSLNEIETKQILGEYDINVEPVLSRYEAANDFANTVVLSGHIQDIDTLGLQISQVTF